MNGIANWSAQPETMAADALRLSGRVSLCVRGESMLPALWPGDVVEIRAAQLADVQSGDIVLAKRDARFFLHRLISMSDSGFITRGDSMPRPDPVYSSEELLGKLTSLVRAGTPLPIPRITCWSRAVGLVFCYIASARRFALNAHQGQTPDLAQCDATLGRSLLQSDL